jgi:hypothetical protein
MRAKILSRSFNSRAIRKNGITNKTGGKIRCDRNQVVSELFLGRINLKRASAYAAGVPISIAIVAEPIEIEALLSRAPVSYTHLTLPTTPYV